jgi:hypothetical protein
MSSGERSSTIETLAERAERAVERVKAAAAKDRAALEQQVKEVDEAAKDKAAKAVEDAVEVEATGIRRWNDIQQSWEAHMDRIRADFAEKKTDLDAKHLANRADDRELDAVEAIAFAEEAIEGAEYAALEAVLARMEADEAGARAS